MEGVVVQYKVVLPGTEWQGVKHGNWHRYFTVAVGGGWACGKYPPVFSCTK
jgi:hypothetical protein